LEVEHHLFGQDLPKKNIGTLREKVRGRSSNKKDKGWSSILSRAEKGIGGRIIHVEKRTDSPGGGLQRRGSEQKTVRKRKLRGGKRVALPQNGGGTMFWDTTPVNAAMGH